VHNDDVPPRFLTLSDVAELLNISAAQTYALVRSGDLPAIKVGGRGQWRVEATELETYIQRMYAQTRDFVDSHPFGSTEDETLTDAQGVGLSDARG
jgi:excisionase family DNA binding protein